MKIRLYQDGDAKDLEDMHRTSELPLGCMPDPTDPLFFIQQVVEHEGKAALAAFVKLTCEPYLLLNHQVGTPEWRWNALQALNDTVTVSVRQYGLKDMTAWIPPAVEPYFSKRLAIMGYIRSPWSSFSKVIR